MKSITLYNTLSGKKERFEIPRRKLKLFVCGPTVYDKSHIGHARTYIFFDVFARYLKRQGARVFYLQNITDVDDKIIRRANEAAKDPLQLARDFTRSHVADMKRLGVREVTKYAPATKEIPTIAKQVSALIEKGFAYEIPGDGWYFDVTKFPEYGKLSRRTTEQAEDGISRIDESVAKRNRADFCLWKFKRDKEPSWKAPFGDGRPGWHIEDTAISEKYFGPQYDLHGGGVDLKFPHHEAEIAQQESASGKKPFVRIWMHAGMLTVEGEKMAKSTGNFITIEDFLRTHSSETFRWIVLSHHYRSPLDYTEASAAAAEETLRSIRIFLAKTALLKKGKKEAWVKAALENAEKAFSEALADDVNTPAAIGHLFSLVNTVQPRLYSLGKADGKAIALWLQRSLALFGIEMKTEKVPSAIRSLVKEREIFRNNKQFVQADELRKKIEEVGYMVEDTPVGPLVLKSEARNPKS